jgi:hypothetical protein
LRRVLSRREGLGDRVWQSFAAHRFDNTCRRDRRFHHLDHDQRMSWLEAGADLIELSEGELAQTDGSRFVFVVDGSLECDGAEHEAPRIVAIEPGKRYRATAEARIVLLPASETAPPTR